MNLAFNHFHRLLKFMKTYSRLILVLSGARLLSKTPSCSLSQVPKSSSLSS